jgi:WD40 repeat protein
MSRRTPVRAILLATILAIALSACGSAQAPAATEAPLPPATPTPAPTPEWQPTLLLRLEHGGEVLNSVAFAPGGEILAAGLLPEIRLWRVSDGSMLRSIELRHAVADLSFSPDGAVVGAGLGAFGALLVRVEDGAELQQLHAGYDNRLAFAPDGRTVATGNREGTVWLWDAVNGERVSELHEPDAGWVSALAYAPDGQLLAAGHFDCIVRLWQVGEGRLLHTLERQGYACMASGLAFSPDGRHLAGAGAQVGPDFVARVWQVADGSLVADLPLSAESTDVAFSPDGQILAVAARDGVTLWRMPDGTLVHTLEMAPDEEGRTWATSLAFSPDGRRLAVARWSGDLELWQVEP